MNYESTLLSPVKRKVKKKHVFRKHSLDFSFKKL